MTGFLEVAPTNNYWNSNVVQDDFVIRLGDSNHRIHLCTTSNSASNSALCMTGNVLNGHHIVLDDVVVAYQDLKLNGVMKGNIAVNSNTATNPLEINSACANNVWLCGGGGNVTFGPSMEQVSLIKGIVVAEQRTASNVGGGTSSNTWLTRTLNTKVVDTNNIATLANDKLTLPPGTYLAEWWADARTTGQYVMQYKTVLYNATTSNDLGLGTGSGYTIALTGVVCPWRSTGVAQFTLAASNDICLRHWHSSNWAVDNILGMAVPGTSYSNIYAQLKVIKL